MFYTLKLKNGKEKPFYSFEQAILELSNIKGGAVLIRETATQYYKRHYDNGARKGGAIC